MHARSDRNDSQAVAFPRKTWEVVAKNQWHDIRLRKFDPLFRQGSESTQIYLVIAGVMCNHQIFTDGRRQVLSFPHAGEAIGLAEGVIHRCGCEAMCDARVRCIPKPTFHEYVESHADIGLRLLDFATVEIGSARDHQVLLGRKTAIEKVASFLLLLSRKQGGELAQETEIHIPMSRTNIADYLGLTIETVCRNLTKLRVESIIDIPESTTVIVRDLDRLEDLGRSEEVTPECWR